MQISNLVARRRFWNWNNHHHARSIQNIGKLK